MRKILMLAALLGVVAAGAAFAADTTTDTASLEKRLRELEKRLRPLEVKAATDRLEFTGDFRFEAHNIDADVPAYVDGLEFQKNFVNTMFYMNPAFTNPMPTSVGDIDAFVSDPANYGLYHMFLDNLQFSDLQDAYAQFAQNPTLFQQIMGLLMQDPDLPVAGYKWKNDIFYTSRLRMDMSSRMGDGVSFAGRLSMYKPWGDSSGVQVFNGQANSMNIDGTTARVPNSDILRVERAYFNWRDIAHTPLYLSFGRRPSTNGPPLHLRDDEMRGGTPLGTVIDFQFDGITAGYALADHSEIRLCYGLGYESGFGNAENLKQPADRLKDCHFLGVNWDLWNTDETLVQGTVARAFDVTDGFDGLVVMPVNPLTGMAVPSGIVMRYSPSANLGDIDLASLLVMHQWQGFDFFASFSIDKSRPDAATTPFGGLFCDPFDTPESQTGKMAYAGARYSFANEKTKLGVEYNKGSKYWFNFAQGADDVFAPKTSTRGQVWELYVTHRITPKFIAKLDFMDYSYNWSGSGWHVGAPKNLERRPSMQAFPAFSSATKLALSLTARF